MNDLRAVKDLGIGDVFQVEGLAENLTVQSAKKIRTGPDAGKLAITVLAADEQTEVRALAPEAQVLVVGLAAEARQGKRPGKSGAAKTKTKAKASQDTAAGTKAEAPKKGRGQKKADSKVKKLSAIDAAARVLVVGIRTLSLMPVGRVGTAAFPTRLPVRGL
jgi:hypothetical protein